MELSFQTFQAVIPAGWYQAYFTPKVSFLDIQLSDVVVMQVSVAGSAQSQTLHSKKPKQSHTTAVSL